MNNTCNKFTLSLDLNPRSTLNYLKIFSKLTGRNNHSLCCLHKLNLNPCIMKHHHIYVCDDEQFKDNVLPIVTPNMSVSL